MGWVGSVIGGAAGILSTPSQLEATNQQNEATKAGYAATDEAITFTQQINRNSADLAANDMSNQTTNELSDQKLEDNIEFSKAVISRGEGVTGGYSLSRELQTKALMNSKKLVKKEEEGQTAINKMYTQMEMDNFRLQQEKRTAWNQANGAIITRDEAGTQMIGSVLGGFQ